jgi:hypothetical protein
VSLKELLQSQIIASADELEQFLGLGISSRHRWAPSV